MIDRFHSKDWPMLPHSEPESYPDDWEQIKPKSLLPAPVLAELSPVTEALRVIERDGEAREITHAPHRDNSGCEQRVSLNLAAGI